MVVGDRLDTDIEGANAIEADSLLVLTGVSTAADALNAPEAQRPTFVSADLSGLNASADDVIVGPRPGWHVSALDSTLTVVATEDDADPAGSPLRGPARRLVERAHRRYVDGRGRRGDRAERAENRRSARLITVSGPEARA